MCAGVMAGRFNKMAGQGGAPAPGGGGMQSMTGGGLQSGPMQNPALSQQQIQNRAARQDRRDARQAQPMQQTTQPGQVGGLQGFQPQQGGMLNYLQGGKPPAGGFNNIDPGFSMGSISPEQLAQVKAQNEAYAKTPEGMARQPGQPSPFSNNISLSSFGRPQPMQQAPQPPPQQPFNQEQWLAQNSPGFRPPSMGPAPQGPQGGQGSMYAGPMNAPGGQAGFSNAMLRPSDVQNPQQMSNQGQVSGLAASFMQPQGGGMPPGMNGFNMGAYQNPQFGAQPPKPPQPQQPQYDNSWAYSPTGH